MPPSSATRAATSSLLLLLYVSLLFVPLRCAGVGFSVELIHRDHPKSPYYDPFSTPIDRTMAAARRSMRRARQIEAQLATAVSVHSVTADITPDPDVGEYLMKYEVGTPPFEIHGVFQTGSGLTWTNCVPCTSCYPQVPPLFNPANSSTYQLIPCDSQACEPLTTQCPDPNTCRYSYVYNNGSSIDGVLAWETLYLSTTDGGTATFPGYFFGCAFQSNGTFDVRAAGIVAFSPGQLSLVTQLGAGVGRKFSYCFPPSSMSNTTTSINFGDAVVYPANAVITPLLPNKDFYVVNLVSILIGSTVIQVPQPASGEGNMLADSGSQLTLLDQTTLQQVVDGVVALVKAPRSTDPAFSIYGVCFQDQGPPGDNYPVITFKFGEGARVDLPPANSFVKPDETVVCLSMGVSPGGLFVLGNVAQQNMLMIYDIELQKLAFAPTTC